MRYEIVPIEFLKPIEKVFPTHLKNLEEMILKDGILLKALIVDRVTGAIMDGSHRYAFLLKHGFKEAPVYWANYDDENVRVGSKLSHRFMIEGECIINKKECRDRALNGKLFSPRTTRHFFTFRKSDISLPLEKLSKTFNQNIDHLMADVDITFEIEHNKKFIEEIDTEIAIILQYLEEIGQTKRYLQKQIDLMDSLRRVAFFPGKFHPPHIGQIQTMLKIIPKYRRVIIGVSEHRPEDGALTTPEEIIKTLKCLFSHFNNVEIVLIKGILVEKENTVGLPDFDVLLSGNEAVLDWAKNVGVECEYISRSAGVLCSGTEVRRLLKNG